MIDKKGEDLFLTFVTDLQNSAEMVLTLDLISEKQRFYWRFCNLAIRVRAILGFASSGTWS